MFAKLFVAVADQANRDCLALSIAITAKERQGFQTRAARRAHLLQNRAVSRVSQDVDRLLRGTRSGTDGVWADAKP